MQLRNNPTWLGAEGTWATKVGPAKAYSSAATAWQAAQQPY